MSENNQKVIRFPDCSCFEFFPQKINERLDLSVHKIGDIVKAEMKGQNLCETAKPFYLGAVLTDLAILFLSLHRDPTAPRPGQSFEQDMKDRKALLDLVDDIAQHARERLIAVGNASMKRLHGRDLSE